MAHKTASRHANSFINNDRANPPLAQQYLYSFIICLRQGFRNPLAFGLENLSECKERCKDYSVSAFSFVSNRHTIGVLRLLGIEKSEEVTRVPIDTPRQCRPRGVDSNTPQGQGQQ